MHDDPLFILAILGLNVAVSEWLVRRTALRHLGTALLVILLTALVANLGVIPTGTGGVPLYDGIFGSVAPLAIFLLLLGVRLKHVRRAGAPMIFLFALGSAGTLLGVLAGVALVGSEALGPLAHAVAGMFAGTYTGGSANFNLIALEYDVEREGLLYTGAVAVDNVFTTAWMVATIALPRLLRGRFVPTRGLRAAEDGGAEVEDTDTETVHPVDLGVLLALGAAAVWGSRAASELLASRGLEVPWVLILTTLALVLAQVGPVARIPGARLVGMFAVYVFLAVIGAYCDFAEFARIGDLGVSLFFLAGTTVAVHGLVVFGGGLLLRFDPVLIAVASQANVGGGTTALALARSLGRPDLVLPSILVGSLGTAAGTYLGVTAAELLAP